MNSLSVCIPLKNRSRVEVDGRTLYLLPNCIRALVVALAPRFDAEIVIADFHSDDWPLDEWLEIMAAPIPVRVIRLPGYFGVGLGFNAAVDHAHSDRLLFLGADMLMSRAVIEEGHRCLNAGIAYFPLVWTYTNPEHTEGAERPFGRGNIFMTKEMRARIGPLAEYRSHGKSDNGIWQRANECCKTKCEQRTDFFHQWHPDSAEWKNRNYPPDWREYEARKVKAYRAKTLFKTGVPDA